jgi:hypothetical protein
LKLLDQKADLAEESAVFKTKIKRELSPADSNELPGVGQYSPNTYSMGKLGRNSELSLQGKINRKMLLRKYSSSNEEALLAPTSPIRSQ